MNKAEEKNHSQSKSGFVSVTVRFITLMQRYSGQREIKFGLPANPSQAIDTALKKMKERISRLPHEKIIECHLHPESHRGEPEEILIQNW